jgi:uncharacterized membrane protein YbhN (UPF0104 family)
MVLVVGLGLTFRGDELAHINHFKTEFNMWIGLGILTAFAAYLVWVSLARRRVRIQGFRLELPGFRLTLGQTILGVIDLCAAAGTLYVLLPSHHGLDFFTFAPTYVFACMLGIASHAPGGIGVFEVVMLGAVPTGSQEALIASLLLFRVIYYLVPFILALAFLGAHESFRRWRTLREAMRRSAEERQEENGEY